jgi:hypothetical protein
LEFHEIQSRTREFREKWTERHCAVLTGGEELLPAVLKLLTDVGEIQYQITIQCR